MKKLSSRKKRIVVVIVAAAVVAGGLIIHQITKTDNADSEADSQVTTVSRHNLKNTTTVSGTLVSKQKSSLDSTVNGVKLASVNVKVGDRVKAGDVLATLDSSDASAELAAAQTALSDSSSKDSISLSQAKRAEEYAVSEASKANSRNQDAVNQAQNDYNAAIASQSSADQEYKAAVAANSEDVNEKKAALNTANDSLRAARDTLTKAKQALEDSIASGNKEILDQQSTVKTASMGTDTSTQKQQIKAAQDKVDACTIKAPHDGIVTAVNFQAGDTYSGGSIIDVQDDSAFLVDAMVDQYDIAGIQNDQKVNIKTGGTDSKEVTGTVTFVSPTPVSQKSDSTATSATSSASSASASTSSEYEVKISLDTLPENMKLGMQVKVEIITSEKKNALAVPDDYIGQNEDGTYYVEALIGSEGKIKKIPVTYGLKTNYYSEISGDGIKKGLKIQVPGSSSGSSDSSSEGSETSGEANNGN